MSNSVKLTNKNKSQHGELLSNRNNSPFILSFKYVLQTGYKFTQLSKADLKIFQSFLDKISNMTFADVDKLYRRNSDKNDTYLAKQVIHYAISKKFRLHGIIEGICFFVVRLDANHNVHK